MGSQPHTAFSIGKVFHPKILELLMLYLPLGTVEGISSGIRGTLGGRRGGFPTGFEQQVPEASNLGYRPTCQTASYAPAILLISRQVFFYVDGSPLLDASPLNMIIEAGNILSVMTF